MAARGYVASVPASITGELVLVGKTDGPSAAAAAAEVPAEVAAEGAAEEAAQTHVAQELLPGTSTSSRGGVSVVQLRALFQEQRTYLDYFFDNLDYEQINSFADLCLKAKGILFFSGVGKSGFIAEKVSQTLVSTGTKSVFLPPTDALHGGLGIVGPGDVLVLMSKSGATEELLRLGPAARAKGALLVGVSSAPHSPLAQLCDRHVHLPLERELCPFGLAPVTSTAIQMLFGDTVAIALMQANKLTRTEYALNHPAGCIGRRLVLKVRDVMRRPPRLPLTRESTRVMDALVELSAKGCGCLLVASEGGRLLGIFTDGDLRRNLQSLGEALLRRTVGEVCHRSPRKITDDGMAIDALQLMESCSPVSVLPVVDADEHLVGILTLHDLVNAGL